MESDECDVMSSPVSERAEECSGCGGTGSGTGSGYGSACSGCSGETCGGATTDIEYGAVTVSDGKGEPYSVRLKLTRDSLVLQREGHVFMPVTAPPVETDTTLLTTSTRTVCISRHPQSHELGISIKGGTEHALPILLSKVNHHHHQLRVGDAIISVNGKSLIYTSHTDAVEVLKHCSSDKVWLTVQHQGLLAPFLSRPDSPADHSSESNTDDPVASFPSVWHDILCLPLQFAYLTRYIANTDKLRHNAFEVFGINGCSSGVIHCASAAEFSEWVRLITGRISECTVRGVCHTNATLNLQPPHSEVTYMGWCFQRCGRTIAKIFHTWKRRFLCLRGSDVCLFRAPPLGRRDWLDCSTSYTIHECLFRVLTEGEFVDNRQNCFVIQSGGGGGGGVYADDVGLFDPVSPTQLYLSVETGAELVRLRTQWTQSLYTSVKALTATTFSIVYQQRHATLTLHFNDGFILLDRTSHACLWRYKFSQLKGSSDDGKTQVCLRFSNVTDGCIEKREFCCSRLKLLLYSINSFLTAKLVSVDPTFLNNCC